MGRTGVRGRGALPRYGPNHEIMAIVTRWKKQKNRPIFVERRVNFFNYIIFRTFL